MSVIGGLESSLGEFQATIAGGLDTLEELLSELGEVDLRSAAQAAFDLMDTITEALRSLDLSLLPDAAVHEVKTTLSAALGDIDLEPVRGTLDEALQAAPLELLDELSARLEAVTAELASFSPAGLLEPLVGPFDDVVGVLVQLDPAQLLDPVIEELRRARASVAGLDPMALLAPLDQPLGAARETLEALDPARLLEPLEAPFAALAELLAKLDVRPFLDELDGLFLSWLKEGLGSLQQLGGAFGGAGGVKTLGDAAAGAATGPDPLGFMPGDVLRPVQDLYETIVGLVDSLPAETLVAAFEELRRRIVGALDAIAPAALPFRFDERLRSARAGFDLVADFGLVEELYARYSALRISFDAVDSIQVPASAQASFELSTGLVSELDPEPLLAPVRTTLRGWTGARPRRPGRSTSPPSRAVRGRRLAAATARAGLPAAAAYRRWDPCGARTSSTPAGSPTRSTPSSSFCSGRPQRSARCWWQSCRSSARRSRPGRRARFRRPCARRSRRSTARCRRKSRH